MRAIAEQLLAWATGCVCWVIATMWRRVLAAADIFALPSYFEGLPMSVIEAMLTGLPVVASDIDGPREQVVHGVTGLLVPPRQVAPLADALARLAGRSGAARGDGRSRARARNGAVRRGAGGGADPGPAGDRASIPRDEHPRAIR